MTNRLVQVRILPVQFNEFRVVFIRRMGLQNEVNARVAFEAGLLQKVLLVLFSESFVFWRIER